MDIWSPEHSLGGVTCFKDEDMYLPLCNVADTPFHIQEDEVFENCDGMPMGASSLGVPVSYILLR